MNLKQWWKHFVIWFYQVLEFPTGKDSNHTWVHSIGSETEQCIICGKEQPNEDMLEELEWRITDESDVL